MINMVKVLNYFFNLEFMIVTKFQIMAIHLTVIPALGYASERVLLGCEIYFKVRI